MYHSPENYFKEKILEGSSSLLLEPMKLIFFRGKLKMKREIMLRWIVFLTLKKQWNLQILFTPRNPSPIPHKSYRGKNKSSKLEVHQSHQDV